jgi:hypothetical protein
MHRGQDSRTIQRLVSVTGKDGFYEEVSKPDEIGELVNPVLPYRAPVRIIHGKRYAATKLDFPGKF